jgi:hypothetical protein
VGALRNTGRFVEVVKSLKHSGDGRTMVASMWTIGAVTVPVADDAYGDTLTDCSGG